MKTDWQNFLDKLNVTALAHAGFYIVLGFILASLFSRLVKRAVKKRTSAQQTMIFGKLVYFTTLIVFLIAALQALGFRVTALLGAAGIFTLAISFASKSSIANIISGLFLLLEKPFQIGDTIKVSGESGKVESIDTLSIKIRAFDNTLIRIPNETVIKVPVINYTRYPTRRLDLPIGVAYSSDIPKLKKLFNDTALQNDYILTNPAPTVSFLAFANSSLNLRFSAWVKKEDYGKAKTSLQEQLKVAFETNGIEY